MDRPAPFAVNLPLELYREIAENLCCPHDIPSLLSLSLVNTFWRTEGQRILFRHVSGGGYYDHRKKMKKWMATHVIFLQTICAHPDRLGPYVRSYGQVGLASDPSMLDSPRMIRQHKEGAALWELTMKALPAFINLKRLNFKANEFRPANLASAALLQCTFFKLQSLSWCCSGMDDNFQEFLLTQGSLLHLDLNHDEKADHDLSQLPQGVCPSLISVACTRSVLPYVSKNRTIIGYRTTNSWQIPALNIQLDPRSAAQLKYLSVPQYVPQSEFSNIVLLHIWSWDMSVIQTLSDLPRLQTLVLGRLFPALDITRDKTQRLNVITEACRRCPKLDRVLHGLYPTRSSQRRYSEFSITRSPAEHDCVAKVKYRKVYRDVEISTLWWDVYDVV